MITEADLLKCTTHKAAHFNGGKDWFGYLHRCNEHPRLARMDRYIRRNRSVESEWRVDGKPVRDLAEAAERLSTPYQPTPDEIALLRLVPEDWTLLEERARFVQLVDTGLVEFHDGKCRLTATGRSARGVPA